MEPKISAISTTDRTGRHTNHQYSGIKSELKTAASIMPQKFPDGTELMFAVRSASKKENLSKKSWQSVRNRGFYTE